MEALGSFPFADMTSEEDLTTGASSWAATAGNICTPTRQHPGAAAGVRLIQLMEAATPLGAKMKATLQPGESPAYDVIEAESAPAPTEPNFI